MWNSPYYSYYPYSSSFKSNIFSKMFQGFSLQKLLDSTQKTLGIINQAIPIYQQMKPIWNNAKTMFQIANEIKESSNISKKEIQNQLVSKETQKLQNSPIFFTN